jgi:hypothetical protein
MKKFIYSFAKISLMFFVLTPIILLGLGEKNNKKYINEEDTSLTIVDKTPKDDLDDNKIQSINKLVEYIFYSASEKQESDIKSLEENLLQLSTLESTYSIEVVVIVTNLDFIEWEIRVMEIVTLDYDDVYSLQVFIRKDEVVTKPQLIFIEKEKWILRVKFQDNRRIYKSSNSYFKVSDIINDLSVDLDKYDKMLINEAENWSIDSENYIDENNNIVMNKKNYLLSISYDTQEVQRKIVVKKSFSIEAMRTSNSCDDKIQLSGDDEVYATHRTKYRGSWLYKVKATSIDNAVCKSSTFHGIIDDSSFTFMEHESFNTFINHNKFIASNNIIQYGEIEFEVYEKFEVEEGNKKLSQKIGKTHTNLLIATHGYINIDEERRIYKAIYFGKTVYYLVNSIEQEKNNTLKTYLKDLESTKRYINDRMYMFEAMEIGYFYKNELPIIHKRRRQKVLLVFNETYKSNFGLDAVKGLHDAVNYVNHLMRYVSNSNEYEMISTYYWTNLEVKEAISSKKYWVSYINGSPNKTSCTYTNSRLYEGNELFIAKNCNFNFSIASSNYRSLSEGSWLTRRNAPIHEFGHFLGFNHPYFSENETKDFTGKYRGSRMGARDGVKRQKYSSLNDGFLDKTRDEFIGIMERLSVQVPKSKSAYIKASNSEWFGYTEGDLELLYKIYNDEFRNTHRRI